MTKNELTNILKEIWDEKDFITGVQLCLSNDEERQMLALLQPESSETAEILPNTPFVSGKRFHSNRWMKKMMTMIMRRRSKNR